MFKGDPLLMSYSYYGKYTKIGGDIIASQNDFSKPGIEISIPNEIFVERGTKHLVNLSVKNIGNTQLNLWLKLEGGLDWIKHSWYTVQPFSSLVYNLDVNNETTYEIMFDIPNNIPLGEYPIVYICESSNYNLSEQKQGTLILYEKYDSELGVTQIIVSNETEIVFIAILTILIILNILTLFIVFKISK